MSSIVVIGSQWGDEGKGKIVDFLAQRADVVVRYSGGSNAGHTVVVNDVAYKLRLLPSGILYKDKTCILGNGVVINPASSWKKSGACRPKALIRRICSSVTGPMSSSPIMKNRMNCRNWLWGEQDWYDQGRDRTLLHG